MVIVALGVLATAAFGRQYGEVVSLAEMELAGLKPHAPPPEHPFRRFVDVILHDFRAMDSHEVWAWAVSSLGPLDEARREDDRMWQWTIMQQVHAAARLMQKEKQRLSTK